VSRRFKRNLLLAEGQQYKLSRSIACQFEVPLMASHGVNIDPEPTAQYMWPKIGGGE